MSAAFLGRAIDEIHILNLVDAASANVLTRAQIIADIILENDADLLAQGLEVIFLDITSTYQNLAFIWIIETRQQFDNRRFSRSIAANQRDGFAGPERKTHVFQGSFCFRVFAGVGKGHVAKLYLQTFDFIRRRYGLRLRRRNNYRLVFEKFKKRIDEQVVFVGVGDTIQHSLKILPDLHNSLRI